MSSTAHPPRSEARSSKLVLCVIDAMAPAMLERAIEAGAAPVLERLVRGGRYVPDCVAAFPSVTPVCAASIVTGAAQDEHHIPGMNWYHREERRYVEYGSSFRAAQRFGIARQLIDTVYNMNGAHLSQHTPTLFETLDDAGARTAGTTYLMYRGRHRHEPQRDTALTRVASTLMRHPVMGPRELFYADIFASRRTGCRSGLGMPGVRDRHSGCVSAYLVENDLFDFLLLSLPDNDWHSHKRGPDAQVQSIGQADLQLARVMNAAGGVDEFLAEHAVIVMADHSQAPVTATIALQDELAELGVLAPSRGAASRAGRGGERASASARETEPRIAVCPSQRAAMVYALRGCESDAMRASVVTRALAVEGVDLVLWLERDAHDAPREAVVAAPARGELRFAPGGEVVDERGLRWSLDGELAVLDGAVADGRLRTPSYPDALARAWAALTCPASGEVLLSAAPGFEFLDWGGQAHVGG
ncbi:MAG TPA: alkaline phosphatase family protein, partial [Solirubrobacteraceae bacterium]|nr:alkaline phosphatase family protein [Solirubrobacteraceae bacterium]